MMICLTREPLLQWYSLSWLLHVSYSPYRQTHRSDTGRTCKIFPGLFLAHLLHRCNTNGVPSEQGQKDTTTVPARQSRSQPLQQWWQEQTILWAYVLLWKLAATLFPIKKKNNICFVTSCTLEQKGLRWFLWDRDNGCKARKVQPGPALPGLAPSWGCCHGQPCREAESWEGTAGQAGHKPSLLVHDTKERAHSSEISQHLRHHL